MLLRCFEKEHPAGHAFLRSKLGTFRVVHWWRHPPTKRHFLCLDVAGTDGLHFVTATEGDDGWEYCVDDIVYRYRLCFDDADETTPDA